ncbi:MAG: serine/threonine protein kinase, partial [Planctomycetota bacterium]|nr:serine/threonine protein kinase [Planctomycetota bacterium]
MNASAGDSAAVERFGDIAIEMGLLSPSQVDTLLAKQKHYKELGIPMRIDSIAVDMGILARADCNIILSELRKRRKLTQPKIERPAAKEQDDDDLVVPCRLGPFEVEERLGGVMGAVYRAYDTNMKRHVALKLLPRSLSHDKQLVERFQREARAAGKLSHPNVVAFYAAGEVERRFYISMEYVDGESLTERLERMGRLPEREALHIVRELAHALYHAHVNALLHRDVKPDNVILDRAGRVRLTDLGLAKVLTEDTRLTESGIAIGTPHYISPEQARGDRVIDRRADLYGLGATLFHLVCGR